MSSTTHAAPRRLHGDVPARWRGGVDALLLACGVAYGLLYVVANDLVAASLYPDYSRMSQAISELSATGSPARAFLVAVTPVFNALLIGFGIGVWRSWGGDRRLRVVGGLLVAQGATAFLWVLAPMSQREAIAAHGGTTSDTLHLVLSAASVVFILSQIGLAARSFGRRFERYSVLSIVAFLASAAVLGVLSPRLASGESTPWLGLVERIMLGAWLLWMAALAVALLRARREARGS